MTTWIHVNNEFLPEAAPAISAFDSGLLHGAGLFETMRAEHGRVFRLEQHLARLLRSAETLLRPLGRDDLPDAAVFTELMQRNVLRSARLRLTVTGGAGRADAGEPAGPTVILSAAPLVEYPVEYRRTGVSVVISPHRQSPSDPLAGHKSTAYLPRLLALRDAQARGGVEGLWFTTDNVLAEGSISNVMLVARGVLKTPSLDTPVLPGVARAAVLALAAAAGVQTQETRLTINDLLDADEIMLTNVIMQVLPVIRVERRDIGDGRVGVVTQRLFNAFRELVQRECAQA